MSYSVLFSQTDRSHNLVNGAAVNVSHMPTTLAKASLSPRAIADMLGQKIAERLKNNHPLSHLHSIFQEPGIAER